MPLGWLLLKSWPCQRMEIISRDGVWLGHVSKTEGSVPHSSTAHLYSLFHRSDKQGHRGLGQRPSRHRLVPLDVTAAVGVGGAVSRVHRTWATDDSQGCADLWVTTWFSAI